MGLYDELTVACKHLPTLDSDVPDLKGHAWQTKSLTKSLDFFRISEEGCLEVRCKNSWKRVEYYGCVRFYDLFLGLKEDLWLEFLAKFDDGLLISLENTKLVVTDNATRLANTLKLATELKKQIATRTKLWCKLYYYLWCKPGRRVCKFLAKVLALLSRMLDKAGQILFPF
jgi:hypothetical protein